MKKIIISIICVMTFVTGCSSIEPQPKQQPVVQSNQNQFVVIENLGRLANSDINPDQLVNIIKDTKTGIKYLWIHENLYGGSGGITPYLDEKGKIMTE